MQIVEKNLLELIPYENNPRKNDKAVEYVANSIKQFGFKVPIVIDKNNVIVAGHTRYKASKKLGLLTVPCIVADDLNEDQIRAFRLADNKAGEVAEWDIDLLDIELQNIDIDMAQFGFEINEDKDKEIIEDDFDPDDAPSRVQEGDIWQLGNHILMCGDSTKQEDVDKLMNGKVADLLFTDPPYNVNVSNSEGMTIKNDNMASAEFREFLDKAFRQANLHLKKGGAFYVWYADSETCNFREMLEKNELSVRQGLIWVKNGFNFGRQDYKWKHEPCLYGWKEGAGHYFVNEFNHPTVIEDEIDLNKMKKEEMKKLLEELLADTTPTTIIHEDKPLKNDLHPTMKPLKLCAELIRHSSKRGELVLDLFGGSGSTMMSCEQLDRTCYSMEYDPKYCDAILKRWEEFTGKEAVKLN